ncbi:hypothetical protein SAMN02927900_01028 [Rhizobium mongolense subsp. loessense]|uniref:Uncharacterized protein n=1 Tax=Rhizobium mongolense subsp. loessense TaxID=158890 RepID=A0A1G4PW90_9HYPH|nr:hypothetical protein SAMN02927900_01028 [Rhizobium mongolense subsp. loessense]
MEVCPLYCLPDWIDRAKRQLQSLALKRFEPQTPDNTDAGENVVTSLFFELIDCLIRAIRKL